MIGPLPLIAPILNPISPKEKIEPVLLTDIGAINSLLTTGLLMPVVQRQVVQNAFSGVIRDLNSRLFRARSNTNGVKDGIQAFGNPDVVGFESTMDSSMLRYLNFASAQNVDYRVALGLRDGVEVEYRDDSMALGDTFWATSPFALSGGPVMLAAAPVFTKAVIAAPAGSEMGGKEVFEDKVIIEEAAFRRFEVFTEFDFGFYDQDNLTDLVRGFDSDTYAGTVGMEYRVLPWLQVGGAFSYLESDTELTANLGGIDLEGTVLSAYVTAFWKRIYFDVLYSYGDFDNEINRNTLLGSRAYGDTDSFSHNVSINIGQSYTLSDQVVAGPFAGLDYATGGIGGYVERGGGSANLIYPDDNFESMVGRLGWQVTYRTDSALGPLTMQGRAGWGHEFMPEADTVRAGLANSPFILVTGNTARRVGGFAAERDSAHPGQDWMELGAGLRFDLNRDWNLQCDYEGQFGRNNASAHFASAKLEYEWGEKFLSRFARDSSGEENSKAMSESSGAASVSYETAVLSAAAPSTGIPVADGATPAGLAESVSCPSARPTHVVDELPSPAPVEERNAVDAAEPEYYKSWDEVPGRAKKSTADASSTERESVSLEEGARGAEDASAVNR